MALPKGTVKITGGYVVPYGKTLYYADWVGPRLLGWPLSVSGAWEDAPVAVGAIEQLGPRAGVGKIGNRTVVYPRNSMLNSDAMWLVDGEKDSVTLAEQAEPKERVKKEPGGLYKGYHIKKGAWNKFYAAKKEADAREGEEEFSGKSMKSVKEDIDKYGGMAQNPARIKIGSIVETTLPNSWPNADGKTVGRMSAGYQGTVISEHKRGKVLRYQVDFGSRGIGWVDADILALVDGKANPAAYRTAPAFTPNRYGVTYVALDKSYAQEFGKAADKLFKVSLTPKKVLDLTQYAADDSITAKDLTDYLRHKGVDVKSADLRSIESRGGEILQYIGSTGYVTDAARKAGYKAIKLNEYDADSGKRAVTYAVLDQGLFGTKPIEVQNPAGFTTTAAAMPVYNAARRTAKTMPTTGANEGLKVYLGKLPAASRAKQIAVLGSHPRNVEAWHTGWIDGQKAAEIARRNPNSRTQNNALAIRYDKKLPGLPVYVEGKENAHTVTYGPVKGTVYVNTGRGTGAGQYHLLVELPGSDIGQRYAMGYKLDVPKVAYYIHEFYKSFPVQEAMKGGGTAQNPLDEYGLDKPIVPEPPRPLAKVYGPNWRNRPDAAELQKSFTKATSARSKALKAYKAYVEQSNVLYWERQKAIKANPAPAAADVYEMFHGVPSPETITVSTPIHHHDNLAALGELVELKINPTYGKMKNRVVNLSFAGCKVTLAANESATQLYFVGGDQSVPLDGLGLDKPQYLKDVMLLGVCYELTYNTKKKFDKLQSIDYYHAVGEVSKECPVITYNPITKQLSIAGGAYTIEDRGIVN